MTRDSIGNTLVGLTLMTLLGVIIAGVTRHEIRRGYPDHTTYKHSVHRVEQVFRDHNGYRTFRTDENGRVHEQKYFTPTATSPQRLSEDVNPPKEIVSEFRNLEAIDQYQRNAIVYRDLSRDQVGYATVLDFQTLVGTKGQLVEIHLPEYQGIEPGNETWGGKYKKHSPMSEVR